MKIKTLKPVTVRNASNGELKSYYCGEVIEVSAEDGAAMIEAGLAEAYTLVNPSGTLSITENGTFDVSAYANANVNVSVATATVTFDPNGGIGTKDPITVSIGNTINLPNADGFTAPEDGFFAGWSTTEGADTPEYYEDSEYTVEGDVTFYAVWEILPPEE